MLLRACAPLRSGFRPAPAVEVMVDLTVACVKPGADPSDRSASSRPFCFRIISPGAPSLTLQAESAEEMRAW